MSSTVTIIGSEAARTALQSVVNRLPNRSSILDPRMIFSTADAADYVAGLRYSLKKQGFSQETSTDLNDMFKAIHAAGTDTRDPITYTGSTSERHVTLRLPEFYRQDLTEDDDRSLVEANFGLLTGTVIAPSGARINFKGQTFARIRQALTRQGEDVTEDTPLATILYSQPGPNAAPNTISRWAIFADENIKASYVVDEKATV